MEGGSSTDRCRLTVKNGSRKMMMSGSRNSALRVLCWRTLVCAAALLFGLAFGLSAQQTAPTPQNKEITIEELFLQSVEFQILREKAFSDDYDMKMNALDDLDKKVSDGSYKASGQQVEFVLEYLALEGSARTTREAGRLVNNFPEVRRRAANMLGRVGTDDARNALTRVLLIDEEPVVKAEAAYALGVIGQNPNNEVIDALVFAYGQEDPAEARQQLRLRAVPGHREDRHEDPGRPQGPGRIHPPGEDCAGQLPSHGQDQGPSGSRRAENGQVGGSRGDAGSRAFLPISSITSSSH